MNEASGTFVPYYLGTGITGIPAPVPEYEETRITTSPVQPNSGKFRVQKRLSLQNSNGETRCKDLIFLLFGFLGWFWFLRSFLLKHLVKNLRHPIIIVVIIHTLCFLPMA